MNRMRSINRCVVACTRSLARPCARVSVRSVLTLTHSRDTTRTLPSGLRFISFSSSSLHRTAMADATTFSLTSVLEAIKATPVLSNLPEDSTPTHTHTHASAAAAAVEHVGPRVICTHSGTFHCDEALACAMLKVLPEFRHASIVRSRVPAVWERACVCVDVCGEYSHETRRYDHHQASFKDTYDARGIRMSSAGLVYKHYGSQVIATILGCAHEHPHVHTLTRKMYDKFIMEIDAIDNGVSVAKGGDASTVYSIHTGLSSRVAHLNPAWNEPADDARVNAAFREAVALTATEFVDAVQRYVNHWLPARNIVEKALTNARSVHPSGQILALDQFCPWKEHLLELEEEAVQREGDAFAKPVYMLFKDSSGSWRVQAIPVTPDSFENRKPLPAPWRGLRDAELSTVSGVPGGVFVHAGGFIGGNATYEGALAMAVKALEFA